MPQIIRLLFLFCMLGCSKIVCATALEKQISDLIHQQLIDVNVDKVVINYPTTKPQLSCDSPTLAILNKNKQWGNLTITAKCENITKYIQIYVAVSGHYVIAKQAISAGTLITEQLVKMQSGQLDKLPATVILNQSEVINHLALRNINDGEVIKNSMLQKNWYVKAGQTVKVIINGEGYSIATHGKTLSNGALGESINIKLNTGNVVEGVVSEKAIIIINK
ncbi:flagella basal body P-ring formation protein FlgA [Gilliamella apis]|nr:flagella basal body P-ring formation protein FlgA [Gilliamella apis]